MKNELLARIGENLKKFRKAKKLKQKHVAEALGVEVPTVSRWETGAMEPSRTHMKALCALYEIEEKDLWPASGAPSAPEGLAPETVQAIQQAAKDAIREHLETADLIFGREDHLARELGIPPEILARARETQKAIQILNQESPRNEALIEKLKSEIDTLYSAGPKLSKVIAHTKDKYTEVLGKSQREELLALIDRLPDSLIGDLLDIIPDRFKSAANKNKPASS